MAIGDSADFLDRLKRLIPKGWFSDTAPYRDALLGAMGDQLSTAYALLYFAKLQTRIATATGAFLDLVAFDYFGLRLRRKPYELDADFSTRIRNEILRPRLTRASMASALKNLTGNDPILFEPRRPEDTGGYRIGGVGYGVAGGYGSLLLPYQGFITIERPKSKGIALVGGYRTGALAYRTPSRSEYASLADSGATVTDGEIYQTIEDTKAFGTTCWVRITA